MHKSFKIPFYHDEKQRVSVGSLKYNLTNSNGEVMEMVIVLPDEKDGLNKLEVWESHTHMHYNNSRLSPYLTLYMAKIVFFLLIL